MLKKSTTPIKFRTKVVEAIDLWKPQNRQFLVRRSVLLWPLFLHIVGAFLEPFWSKLTPRIWPRGLFSRLSILISSPACSCGHEKSDWMAISRDQGFPLFGGSGRRQRWPKKMPLEGHADGRRWVYPTYLGMILTILDPTNFSSWRG